MMLSLLLLFCPALWSQNWTVLVYMAADNNLWQNAIANINAMESVDLPPGLKLVVQSDMPAESPYPGGQRRLIKKDNSDYVTSPVLQNLGVINSGDPQTLNSFARWGFNKYPSSRRALIIWGHGNSWYKGSSPKWICPDDSSSDMIRVYDGELKEALSNLPPLDILLFDACSMQSLEVMSEVCHAAKRVIASAELVPAKGFPYQELLGCFESGQSSDQVASGIVDKFLEAYSPGGIFNPYYSEIQVTCSALRSQGWDAFLEEFGSFVRANKHRAEEMLSLREGCWEMNDGYSDIDVAEYLARLKQHGSAELAASASRLLDRWEAMIIKAGNLFLPKRVGSAALWFPWHRQYFDSRWQLYSRLDFAHTMWLSLLNLAYGADDVPPGEPVLTSYSQSLGSVILNVGLPMDPDALKLVLSVESPQARQDFVYQAQWGERELSPRIPLSESGTIIMYCLDQSGNRSHQMSYEISLREQPLNLEIHPNPVMASLGSMLRWYVPPGFAGKASLSLYDLKGRLVLLQELGMLPEGEGTLLSNNIDGFVKLPRGIYLLRLKVGSRFCRAKLTIL